MKVAITGASGFIGTALSRALAANGHTVVPIVRHQSTLSGLTDGPRIGWDPAASVLDPNDLRGVDVVVNLAGPGIADRRWSRERKHVLRVARIRATTTIANAMAALATDGENDGPTHLLNASAIGYYGDRGDEILVEDSAPGTGFLPDLCRDWEHATNIATEAGLGTSVLRTGIVLDSHGGALPKMLRLFRLGLGGRFGSGDQWMSWITLHDHVRAVEFLATNRLPGAFNLTAPNPVTNAVFARSLGRALNRPALVPVPAFGPRLVLGKELADALLFDSARVKPVALETAGFKFEHPELDEALSAIVS